MLEIRIIAHDPDCGAYTRVASCDCDPSTKLLTVPDEVYYRQVARIPESDTVAVAGWHLEQKLTPTLRFSPLKPASTSRLELIKRVAARRLVAAG